MKLDISLTNMLGDKVHRMEAELQQLKLTNENTRLELINATFKWKL